MLCVQEIVTWSPECSTKDAGRWVWMVQTIDCTSYYNKKQTFSTMNIFTHKLSSLLLVATLGIGGATAQSTVDVGLFDDGNNNLELRVRPNSNFDGIFSNLVFTVRWDANTNATLGDPAQIGAEGQYMPLMKSGGLHVDGTTNYQIYTGIGMQALNSSSTEWMANEEIVIATIPVTGTALFEIANDAWTGDITNNGDFYISLGGLDKTGIVYSTATGIDENSNGYGVSIQPNPNDGQFNFIFNTENRADYQISLVNALGQTMFEEKLNGFSGSFQKDMDLTEYSNGLYYLKIFDGNNNSVHKVIYK